MKAVVVNFCGGKTSKKGNHVVVELAGVKSKDAASRIIGKKVVWTSPAGKKINGEVKKAHGNSGAVKAIMEKGLPGTALGKEISVEG